MCTTQSRGWLPKEHVHLAFIVPRIWFNIHTVKNGLKNLNFSKLWHLDVSYLCEGWEELLGRRQKGVILTRNWWEWLILTRNWWEWRTQQVSVSCWTDLNRWLERSGSTIIVWFMINSEFITDYSHSKHSWLPWDQDFSFFQENLLWWYIVHNLIKPLEFKMQS